MDIELKDMKRSAPDPTSGPQALAVDDNDEQYPYGLNIRLDGEELKKLGILPKMMALGAEFHGSLVACVSATNCNPNDPDDCSMSLQITALGLALEAPHPGEGKETIADENREQRSGKPYIVS